jgi:peptidoglycan hydrolase CwlO-like protein
MFDELRGLVERQASLHTDHAAELKGIRDELEQARQDAGLWREKADHERARIANLQADAEHTEREMARLRDKLEQAEQARRRWWHRWLSR